MSAALGDTVKDFLDLTKAHSIWALASLVLAAALSHIGSLNSIPVEYRDNERQFIEQTQLETDLDRLLTAHSSMRAAAKAVYEAVASYEAFRKTAYGGEHKQASHGSARSANLAEPVIPIFRSTRKAVATTVGVLQGTQLSAKPLFFYVEGLTNAFKEVDQVLATLEEHLILYSSNGVRSRGNRFLKEMLEAKERYDRNSPRISQLLIGLATEMNHTVAHADNEIRRLREQRDALDRRVMLGRIALGYIILFLIAAGLQLWKGRLDGKQRGEMDVKPVD